MLQVLIGNTGYNRFKITYVIGEDGCLDPLVSTETRLIGGGRMRAGTPVPIVQTHARITYVVRSPVNTPLQSDCLLNVL